MSPAPWKGPQKVAALLFSLDPDLAAGILSQFSEEEIAEVGTAMATLDPATMQEESIGALHKEFVDSMIQDTGEDPNSALPSAGEVLDELLGRTLPPDKARQIRSRIESAALKNRPFINLEKLKLDTLRKVLDGEHPQVVALVCSKMSPDSTAAVLAGMPEEERNDVVQRMAVLENPKPEFLKAVVSALEGKAAAHQPPPAKPGEEAVEEERADPTKRLRGIAEILKTVEVEVEKSILKNLDEKDPELAKQIRELMFTFEDLASLEKKAMQKLLMGIETRTLAVALKAVEPAVEANFLNNMSKRVQAMLAEERELLEAVSVEEITNAQKEIMASVRNMIEGGEIQIPRKGAANAKPK